MHMALRAFVLLFVLVFSPMALASAIVEAMNGTVRAGPSATTNDPVALGQRIGVGNTIVTGPRSHVSLRFDDGQIILLNDETEIRVEDYAYNQRDPDRDKFLFRLLRGAVRVVTALLTERNPQAFQLQAPQATFGVRGTDFMVALSNGAYLGVLQGTVSATNAAGTAIFATGATALAIDANTLPVLIPASALPPAVAAAFKQLSAFPLTAAGANPVGGPGDAARGPAFGFGSGAGTGPAGPGGAGGTNSVIGPSVSPGFGSPLGPGGGGFGKGPLGPGKP